MNTATIRPSADVIQGWGQVPNDGLAHYLKIDEAFDSFDSADYLWDSGGLTVEHIQFSDLPGDIDYSVSVRLRAYAWSDDALATLGLLFDVAGNQIADPSAGWDFSALALSTWHSIDLTIGTFPVLHGGETILLLPVGQAVSGSVRLGQVELIVTYIEKRRHYGDGESLAPLASADNLQHYRALPASLAPGAAGASLSPGAAGAPRNPDGEAS